MAESALTCGKTNASIATTGVAGPGKGEGGIQPGTVCFAWSFQDSSGNMRTFTETKKFEGDRNEIREAAADFAIERLPMHHKEVLEKQKKADL